MITRVFDTSATINAPPSAVWRALTDPALMKQWMAEPEMRIDIVTNWRVGGPIVVSGWHHINFENKGIVLGFEPNSTLRYSHLSSVSRLPDKPENYTIIEFRLRQAGAESTSLNLSISGFPTESIFRHFDFYWRTTIHVLKRFIENVDLQGSEKR
ncbi:MAG TPA: SRPBCC domain-containing protein [Bryobacteraceae bacterium]|jgi:uncharacterized protein YndB with AHSA1/START domain|nr:SRPBCC domain-containing protein [Bryobacteraceae bacterium]